jgi:hypothetical protein
MVLRLRRLPHSFFYLTVLGVSAYVLLDTGEG